MIKTGVQKLLLKKNLLSCCTICIHRNTLSLVTIRNSVLSIFTRYNTNRVSSEPDSSTTLAIFWIPTTVQLDLHCLPKLATPLHPTDKLV